MSIIVTQSLSWEIELNAFLKYTKHIQSGCWCTDRVVAEATVVKFCTQVGDIKS